MKTKKVKQKPCKHCKKLFTPSYNSLQPACSMECAIILGKIKLDKEKKEIKVGREKKEKADLKVLKIGMVTHPQWLNILQVKINHIARLIDTDFSCISSRRTKGQWHGGHFFTRQAHPNIRFHLFNIWKQSAQDNTHKSGNITEYLFNLHRLFGSDFVNNELLQLDVKYPVTKLSIPEIKKKIEVCRAIIKRQQKGEFIAKTIGDRITIRIELNQLIGIYK